ncbi:alanine/ornithine racemase family PLP-dependent enzyme [Clostridium tagluense]|uniref:alanine racemase n=1 Tax=Clostridium tagluense TaxID=360422 RepID=UPI001CF48C73|nr:alanine/ornithine racemase family PLP-dependent enzyme [Clostridium tagluense]MCB2313035.1 alanine/ornithine racemase family PLP-dependent enzyme [Clostridium tagluense]MCB2317856.1 alanine/ornithine racemase family PLP-dependent enzyme [Clostridium tagluense]MCB2322641.1 alanine/ornithine racemase family PLP-dependent enzyme [Clostridium tagluense]MCB2327584.1 alanine/ornithine racemase family PLP-dependent enzyme [Clostridium tagluense]MCB2332285.1 alanine/ornithine racemase family PLP-de
MNEKTYSEFKYPMLEINLKHVYENVKSMVDLCKSHGISIAGVIKGFNAIPEVVKQFERAGCTYLATSRMNQIIKLKQCGIEKPFMMIRIPMFSEIKELVQFVAVSLNSELETLNMIQKECELQDKKHKVILMLDLGDLREGVFDEEEFIKLAEYVENHLENVELYGVGTNLGCYGSIRPTEENLGKLCRIAEIIESKINRRLEMISGGATTSLPLILDGEMPKRVNNLRIGEGMLLAEDLEKFWGYDMKHMHKDTFTLKAQVVEIKRKPTHPIGEIFIDAFGNKPTYEDNGIRKRALLAVGKQDFVLHDKLIPLKQGVEIIGSSSDHLIIDIEDCDIETKLGDILDFIMYYPPMMYLSGYADIPKVFI